MFEYVGSIQSGARCHMLNIKYETVFSVSQYISYDFDYCESLFGIIQAKRYIDGVRIDRCAIINVADNLFVSCIRNAAIHSQLHRTAIHHLLFP